MRHGSSWVSLACLAGLLLIGCGSSPPAVSGPQAERVTIWASPVGAPLAVLTSDRAYIVHTETEQGAVPVTIKS